MHFCAVQLRFNNVDRQTNSSTWIESTRLCQSLKDGTVHKVSVTRGTFILYIVPPLCYFTASFGDKRPPASTTVPGLH